LRFSKRKKKTRGFCIIIVRLRATHCTSRAPCAASYEISRNVGAVAGGG